MVGQEEYEHCCVSGSTPPNGCVRVHMDGLESAAPGAEQSWLIAGHLSSF